METHRCEALLGVPSVVGLGWVLRAIVGILAIVSVRPLRVLLPIVANVRNVGILLLHATATVGEGGGKAQEGKNY